ncbi:MAG: hypothetical protein DRJ29_11870 [Bacteroidetes bacterium]|nr:MAG: hypothetical protein DRJ29_11870 [Bacteroidota bacterium]RLD98878.1 MAG: hypothetical protein DRJ13_10405 [Bacteroidota bacterium]HDN58809.1 hypothetical protein [Candidatus Neomarinimicrobiota bacterium]
MSYQEKQNIVNIFSGLLVTIIYALMVYQRHQQGQFDLTDDFQTWGRIFLVFIGISVAVRIVIQIIFHIINAIATREEDVPLEDERDQLIKLKATRNSYYAFTSGFVLSVLGLALGMPVHWIFIAFVAFGLIAEILDNGSQIYYYRKGI